MMRLLLLGGPASGKGTQALRLIKSLGIPQISASEILRTASGKIGRAQEVKKIMESGNLVPDKLMVDLVKQRLQGEKGYLLDGFPRTIEQLKAFNSTSHQPSFFGNATPHEHFPVDHVIELTVPDKEVIERISGRQIHLPSGRVYHEKFNPPKVKGIDDITGEKLVTRADDNTETIKKRLDIYHHVTEPVLNYFRNLAKAKPDQIKYHRIDGTKDVDTVFDNILKAIKEPPKCENQFKKAC